MIRTSPPRLIVVVLAFLGAGCVHYEALPFDPLATVEQEDRDRHRPLPAGPTPGIDELEARMSVAGPRVREALAAYRRAEARARAAEPWPNPTIEFGPNLGLGRDVMRKALVPFGSLGLTIPLGDRIESRRELDRVRAEAARVEVDARLRESALELRRLFESQALAEARLRLAEKIAADAARSTELSRRLIEAGSGSALDLALFRLEEGRARLEVNAGSRRATAARSMLTALIGVAPELIGSISVDRLPRSGLARPGRDELIRLIAAENGELARRRAAYEESEAALRLAVAEQYPDLQLGFSGEDEAGEDRQVFGLALGIELPIFDRNQKEIAEAEARREEARESFAAKANELLARLDHALLEFEVATERLRLLDEELLPEIARNRERVRQALAAGSTDALRLLETERQGRRLELDRLDADQELRGAWAELEAVVGLPLRVFPGESIDPEPATPTENPNAEEVER